MTRIGTLVTKSMTVLDSTDENRFFEGYLTVEMKDKQGEITVVDELYKVLPIWIDRGAPITDTHSNRVIGKGINFAKTTVEDGGVTYPAIKITGKIHKNYELDTDIWEKIKSGEYKGLSFGGATKANRVPKVMKDGDIAYALTDLEHYEVAVCRDPAVPLALITEFNSVAKATVPSEPRGDGNEVIKCSKWGCYVTKGEDWSNADITPATVTNTVSQSTQTAKPIKTDSKVGVPEKEGGVKLNVTPLEGGIGKNDTPASSGTGGGVRAHIDDASNQDDPVKQTAQVSEKIEVIRKADINKVIGAILGGAAAIGAGAAASAGLNTAEAVKEKIVDEPLEPIESTTGETVESAEKSGATTEEGNIQLGNPSIPKELKEKLVSSLGTQNKEQIATVSKESNYCVSCGQKKTEGMKQTYPETNRPHSDCPSCAQKKRQAAANAEAEAKMEQIHEGVHRNLAAHGRKVTRFSTGKAPKTYNG